MQSKRLAECQRVIGYHFANPALLEIALTHSSVRTPDKECNERQEFLGDSVLGLTITEELYKRLPDQQEGELTRIKSAVVSRGALYRVSMRLGLPRFVEVAKGVGRREELPVSVTANLVESIIGAIYLDAGYFPAREFILRYLGPELEDVFNDRVPKNFKSLLQQECQRILGTTPTYRTIEAEGPDHRKAFTVAAVVRGQEYGRATGVNKKEAEQEAARHALEALQRRGRGRRRRAGPREDRAREEAKALLSRQSRDEDSWKSWAEREGGGAAAPPIEGSVPAAEPGAPRSIGPEPEEAWGDEGEAAAPPSSREEAAAGAEAASEAVSGNGAPAGEPPRPGEAPAGEATGEGGEGEPRRRRRRRRGGRGRGGREGPEGLDRPDRPERPPPDEFVPIDFPETTSEPAREPVAESPLPPEPAPATVDERPEPPREPRPERARRAPREPRPRRESPPPPPPPPAPAPAGPSFGEGVAAGEPAPAPKEVEREVTKVGGVEAKKKAPLPPKPEAPPDGGGFGAGL